MENRKVTAIIQARMGSSRLPGKMLMPIVHGKGALELMLERVSNAKKIHQIIIATTSHPQDDGLAALGEKLGYKTFRGDEADVLDRFYQAARKFDATDVIVRLTGDCPLHDPRIIDKVIQAFLEKPGSLYASNINPPTYPDGMDAEVLNFEALETAWKEAKKKSDREHVTLFIRNNPERFGLINVANDRDESAIRITLDEKEDFKLIGAVFEHFYGKNSFGLEEIVEFIKTHRNLKGLNAHIARDEGLKKSLMKDHEPMKKSFLKSKSLLERALKVTPVASQTYSKSFRYFSGEEAPYFMERGLGSHVWDADGNEFVDFILGLGPVTVGYNHPEINEAITAQLKKGISFSQSTELEILLAEKLCQVIPSAEMVRFVKNGSDATSSAIRLARAFTGREMVAACGYHGMQDWYIGSTQQNMGIPESVCRLTKKFEYNNLDSLKALFQEFPGKIAAVILEPVQDNGPGEGFLQQVKDLTAKEGALLIFDEVITGFRIALGGAQAYYQVVPDLSAIGKGMANGMPLSAVVGKKEILKLIEGGAFISTTFGGETLSLAAALKTIEILERKETFPYLWQISSQAKQAMEVEIKKEDLGSCVEIWGLAPHSGYIFRPSGALSPNDLLSVYQSTLLKEGILSLGINNFCLAHEKSDIENLIRANALALCQVKKAMEQNSLKDLFRGNKIDPIFKRN